MAFSQSAISSVSVQVDGTDLFVSWISTAPPNTTYQVYVDHRLSWFGMAQQCHVPIPSTAAGRNVWVEVGTVDPGAANVDFSSSLTGPSGSSDQVLLSWLGGTYLDPTGNDDVQGFFVYQSSAANAPISYTSHIDSLLAYPGGWISDGFGLGGFGLGGFGRAARSYRWRSDPLSSGLWQFAVVPYDKAGNSRDPGQTASVTISTAPLPPALGPSGTRLSYTYSAATQQATLNWLASPSASS